MIITPENESYYNIVFKSLLQTQSDYHNLDPDSVYVYFLSTPSWYSYSDPRSAHARTVFSVTINGIRRGERMGWPRGTRISFQLKFLLSDPPPVGWPLGQYQIFHSFSSLRLNTMFNCGLTDNDLVFMKTNGTRDLKNEILLKKIKFSDTILPSFSFFE